MAEIITRLKFETDEFHNRARRAAQEFNDMAHQAGVAGNSISTTNEKNVKLAKSLGSMQTVSTTLRGKISELSDAFIAAGNAYNSLTAKEKNDPFGRELAKSMEQLKVRVRETKAELAGLESSLNGASAGGGFGKKFMQGLVPGFGMGAGMVGAMAAVRAVHKVAQLGREAISYNIQTNMEFEQSNANLAAVLGKTREEIYALTTNAKNLGATTLFTANQIAELQTVLARRGFTEDQILQMTHGISNLAIATGTNLAQSAELAASTMQAFGMKATEMEHIVSILGVSTTKCALTTEKLGTSLQYVAPTAKAAGFSLEDTVAMLGKLVDAGLDASTAGTSLRQIILSISTSNGKLAKSFGEPVRNIEDFISALESVSNASDMLSGVSEELRVTAVPALIALANNKDGLRQLREELNDVGDSLQEMADTQANTLQGQVTLLTSAWDGLMLSMSNSSGILKNTVYWMTELINSMRDYFNLNTVDNEGLIESLRRPREETAKDVNRYINDSKKNYKDAGVEFDEEKIINKARSELDRLSKELEPLEERRRSLESTMSRSIDGGRGGFESSLASFLNGVSFGLITYDERGPLATIQSSIANASNGEDIAKREYEAQVARTEFRYDVAPKIAKNLDDSLFWKNVLDIITGERDESIRLQEDEEYKATVTTPVKQATDGVAEALRRYYEELKEAKVKLDAGLIDQAEFDKIKVRLSEMVFEAYGKGLEKVKKAEKAAENKGWGGNGVISGNILSKEYQAGYDRWFENMVNAADVAAVSSLEKSVANALKKYSNAIEISELRTRDGLQDELSARRSVLSATENLYSAYSNAYLDAKNETQRETFRQRLSELSDSIKSLTSEINDIEEDIRQKNNRKSIDNRTLSSIMSMARSNKIAYGDLGLSGMKERINAKDYFDIPDNEWLDIVKKLNQKLKENGVKWTVELDVETGTLQKTEDELKKLFDRWSNGIGAVDSIVGALDNIKKAGVSAKEAIEGDGDAWDKMMALFNAALAPLEAVVTIYEAVNTLMAISSALKDKDTVSTVAHATAEGADASASSASAAASGAEAVAKGAKAVSWLPIVGPILAVAAIAAIAGGIAASRSKTEYHADGGMAGNPLFKPRGTDTVPAMLSPGEIILNKAQQTNVAAQLQPSRVLSGGYGGHVTFEIDGRKLIGTINNEIAATGGGRAHRIYSH